MCQSAESARVEMAAFGTRSDCGADADRFVGGAVPGLVRCV